MSLVRRSQETLVKSSSSELARRGVGGGVAVLGAGALAVPLLAAFIPLVGTGLLAIAMVIVGLVMLLK